MIDGLTLKIIAMIGFAAIAAYKNVHGTEATFTWIGVFILFIHITDLV